MKPIIEVKNIGKKYTINHQRGSYVALRDILAGAFRNPFSFLKRNIKGVFETKEPFWALKDVSFTVNKGEVVGIIGRNGAGKSTLLKILSRITPPTTGEIKIHGTVGSLLEVGTGFHPELTGRENIFLNGAILGMKKAEIVQKFDEIVAFAGIEKFLDTPVKYYSSGMYVRLAFSVAAHLDPDILIVDEVLAVGDAEFQKKCLGKMEEITQQEGRTILFVSHNMTAVRQLCNKCVLLENGSVVMYDDTEKVIEQYLTNKKEVKIAELNYLATKEKDAEIIKISILNSDKKPSTYLPNNENFFIEIEYEVYKKIEKVTLCVFFFQEKDFYLLSTETDKEVSVSKSLHDFEIGKYKTLIEIPSFVFTPNSYNFMVSIERPFENYCVDEKRDIGIDVSAINDPKSPNHKGKVKVSVAPLLNYTTIKLQ